MISFQPENNTQIFITVSWKKDLDLKSAQILVFFFLQKVYLFGIKVLLKYTTDLVQRGLKPDRLCQGVCYGDTASFGLIEGVQKFLVLQNVTLRICQLLFVR